MIPTHCAVVDWPRLRERLGLRVVGPGDPAAWPPQIVVEQLQQSLGLPAPEPERPADSPLTRQLAALFAAAERNPGEPQRLELESGMRLDVIVGLDGMSRLQLSRERRVPDAWDWALVAARLPYDPPLDADPQPMEYKGRGYLRVAWETKA